jgi:hypothetical protein
MGEMHVVCWDPHGEFWEGALVDRGMVGALRARGVATLPVEQELILRSAVGGYFRRSWGSGWPIGTPAPRFCCPMILHVAAGDALRRLNWCARLVPVDGARGPFRGALRLAAHSGQPAAFSGGFGSSEDTCAAAERLASDPDEHGGWTVGGGGSMNSSVDGMFGCALYGQIAGLAVAWAAVSQSR